MLLANLQWFFKVLRAAMFFEVKRNQNAGHDHHEFDDVFGQLCPKFRSTRRNGFLILGHAQICDSYSVEFFVLFTGLLLTFYIEDLNQHKHKVELKDQSCLAFKKGTSPI